jgi:hypothetical protein
MSILVAFEIRQHKTGAQDSRFIVLTSIVSGREGSLTLFSMQCEKVISNHFLRCLIPILLFGATVVHYEKSREFALLRRGDYVRSSDPVGTASSYQWSCRNCVAAFRWRSLCNYAFHREKWENHGN